MHGENYNYCYVSKKRWDYCTPSKDAGQDPHCVLKTYHLLWIGCIIAVFIAICIFYWRKKYQIQSAEVNLGFVKVDVEKRDENPSNIMASNQNNSCSIEQAEVESNTSGSQILCQTTSSTQSDTYNENPSNILAANQKKISAEKIDENPPNIIAADQNSSYSIEQAEVESNTSGSQILCQTTPLTQSVTYNENTANILAANQNNSSSIKIFHEKTHGSVHEDRKAFNREF